MLKKTTARRRGTGNLMKVCPHPWFKELSKLQKQSEDEAGERGECQALPVQSTPSPVKPSGQEPQTKPDSFAGGFKSMHWTPG